MGPVSSLLFPFLCFSLFFSLYSYYALLLTPYFSFSHYALTKILSLLYHLCCRIDPWNFLECLTVWLGVGERGFTPHIPTHCPGLTTPIAQTCKEGQKFQKGLALLEIRFS